MKFVGRAKRGGICSTLGPRLSFGRKGALLIKETLNEMKDDTNKEEIERLISQVEAVIREELEDGEDKDILYIDGNIIVNIIIIIIIYSSK